jgi:hypothetical protein
MAGQVGSKGMLIMFCLPLWLATQQLPQLLMLAGSPVSLYLF